MSVPKCSLSNRPDAWSILREPFCEVHKEEILARYGIDHFPMRRISDAEESFVIRGRHKPSSQDPPESDTE